MSLYNNGQGYTAEGRATPAKHCFHSTAGVLLREEVKELPILREGPVIECARCGDMCPATELMAKMLYPVCATCRGMALMSGPTV